MHDFVCQHTARPARFQDVTSQKTNDTFCTQGTSILYFCVLILWFYVGVKLGPIITSRKQIKGNQENGVEDNI